MKTDELVAQLDEEFGIAANAEDLLEFAVVDDNRHLLASDFIKGKTGLLLKSSEDVERVFTAVFISAGVVKKVVERPKSLVFTHHHFDYFEDERGLQPIPPGVLESLRANQVSIYVAHAPLDGRRTYGTGQRRKSPDKRPEVCLTRDPRNRMPLTTCW